MTHKTKTSGFRFHAEVEVDLVASSWSGLLSSVTMQEGIMRRVDCLEREAHARRRCDQAKTKTKTMEDDGCVPWISPLELERDPWVGVGVNHTVRFFWKMRNSFGYHRSALADLTTCLCDKDFGPDPARRRPRTLQLQLRVRDDSPTVLSRCYLRPTSRVLLPYCSASMSEGSPRRRSNEHGGETPVCARIPRPRNQRAQGQ